ncbi:MAG: hypothetical protein ACR2GX_04190 [Candidatus Dormibacteria bacterium]
MAESTVPRLDLTDPALLARLGRMGDPEVRAQAFSWAVDLAQRGRAVGTSPAAELAELRKPPFGDLKRLDSPYGALTAREQNWILDHDRADLLKREALTAYLRARLARIKILENLVKADAQPSAESQSPVSRYKDAIIEQIHAERPPLDESTGDTVAFRLSDAQLETVRAQPQRLGLWAAALKAQQATDEAAGQPPRPWWGQNVAALTATLGAQAQMRVRPQMPQLAPSVPEPAHIG